MRKNIRIMALALSVFALSGGAALAEEAPASGQAQRVEQSTTRVYYFHGNIRCKTCNKIERVRRTSRSTATPTTTCRTATAR